MHREQCCFSDSHDASRDANVGPVVLSVDICQRFLPQTCDTPHMCPFTLVEMVK